MPYNELLRKLKEEFSTGDKAPFWQHLCVDGELRRGLISSEETDESEIDADAARAFLVCAPSSATAPSPAPPPVLEEEDDFDDLE